MGMAYIKGRKEVRFRALFRAGLLDLILSSIAINLLGLAMPIAVLQVYDRIIFNQAEYTLYWIFGGSIAAVFIEVMLRILRANVTAWISARYEHFTSTNAVQRILNSRIDFFEADEIGVHNDRLQAISVLRGFYAGQIFQVLLDLPFSFMFLAAIYMIFWPLGVLASVLIAVFCLCILVINYPLKRTRDIKNEHQKKRLNNLMEIFHKMQFIKSWSFEERMLRQYEKHERDLTEVNNNISFWSNVPNSLGNFYSQLMLYSIIGIGAMYAVAGQVTIGMITACMMLGNRALNPIQKISSFWLRFSEAKIAKEKVDTIYEISQEVDVLKLPFPRDIDGGIIIDNISYICEHSGKKVFEDMALEDFSKEYGRCTIQ